MHLWGLLLFKNVLMNKYLKKELILHATWLMNIKLRSKRDLINIHAAACAQCSDWTARASTERMRTEQRILCAVRRGLALRASLDFKSGRLLASPHQRLQRENSWNTREHPVLVSDCLWTDDVMFIIHTHTHARARWILIIPIDPMHLRCSNFIELRIELSLSCTGCALRERDLTLLTVTSYVMCVYDRDDDDDDDEHLLQMCVCASSDVRH